MDAARGGGDQLLFDLQPIQAVENDLDALFRSSDSIEKRLNAVAWLNDNLHLSLSPDSLHQLTHGEAGSGPAPPPPRVFISPRPAFLQKRFCSPPRPRPSVARALSHRSPLSPPPPPYLPPPA